MKFSVAYHQVDHSDALNVFISNKVDKLDKIIESKNIMNWIIEKKDKSYSSSAKIHLFGKEFYVHAQSPNIYSSVSKAFDKINDKIRNHKAKIARSVHNIQVLPESI